MKDNIETRSHKIAQTRLNDPAWSRTKEETIFPQLFHIYKNNEELRNTLSNTILVAVQHRLLTTAWLLETAIDLGVKPENIFFLDKMYSRSKAGIEAIKKLKDQLTKQGKAPISDYENKDTFNLEEDYATILTNDVQRMLQDVIKHLEDNPNDSPNLTILDDGGILIMELLAGKDDKYKMIFERCAKFSCVEQTTKGKRLVENEYLKKNRNIPIPYIDCTSTPLKIINSQHLAEAAWRIYKKFIKNDHSIGIISGGNIGRAIHDIFANRTTFTLRAFDKDLEIQASLPEQNRSSLNEIILHSDTVFGATGEDLFGNIEDDIISLLKERDRDITFICTSSCRIDFISLMQRLAYKATVEKDPDITKFNYDSNNPLKDITLEIKTKNRHKPINITFFRGGFPANFHPLKENSELVSLKTHDMQGHRAELTLAALIQAPTIADKIDNTGAKNNLYRFHPALEQKIMHDTMANYPEFTRYTTDDKLEEFNNLSKQTDDSEYAEDITHPFYRPILKENNRIDVFRSYTPENITRISNLRYINDYSNLLIFILSAQFIEQGSNDIISILFRTLLASFYQISILLSQMFSRLIAGENNIYGIFLSENMLVGVLLMGFYLTKFSLTRLVRETYTNLFTNGAIEPFNFDLPFYFLNVAMLLILGPNATKHFYARIRRSTIILYLTKTAIHHRRHSNEQPILLSILKTCLIMALLYCGFTISNFCEKLIGKKLELSKPTYATKRALHRFFNLEQLTSPIRFLGCSLKQTYAPSEQQQNTP